jgi:hypothetical protein
VKHVDFFGEHLIEILLSEPPRPSCMNSMLRYRFQTTASKYDTNSPRKISIMRTYEADTHANRIVSDTEGIRCLYDSMNGVFL